MSLEQQEKVGLVNKFSSNISLSSKAMKLSQHQGRRSPYYPEAAREIEGLQLPSPLPISLGPLSHWAQHRVASPKYECAHITRYIVVVAARPSLFPAQLCISNKMGLQSFISHCLFLGKELVKAIYGCALYAPFHVCLVLVHSLGQQALLTATPSGPLMSIHLSFVCNL